MKKSLGMSEVKLQKTREVKLVEVSESLVSKQIAVFGMPVAELPKLTKLSELPYPYPPQF